MLAHTTGGSNVAIGYQAMLKANHADADANVIVGSEAGNSLTTGNYNTVLGYLALSSEDEGSHNVAIGYLALEDQDAGADAYNVAVGYRQVKKLQQVNIILLLVICL